VLVGKYRIDRILGQGGMGIVYAAYHELLGQSVALKMLRPEVVAKNSDAVARFLNEGRAAARLENAHVARLMDVGLLDGGLPYLVMELLEGADLAHVLETRGRMPVATVVDYLMEAIEAIAEAHSMGIVHRDLKPSNLFLARRKEGETIKVLDFGISKAGTDANGPASGITATNAVLGSPGYMSPEQLRSSKTIDARADIWSLGVILFELLSGSLPFDGPNVVAIFAAIQETDAPRVESLRSDIPPRLAAAVHRCLRRSAADRFATVTELAAEIAPFGSPRAMTSLERIRATLPMYQQGTSETLLATGDKPPARAVSSAGGISPAAMTTGGVVHGAPAVPARSGKRTPVVASIVGVGILLAAGAIAGLLMMRAGPKSVPAASPEPPPAISASAPAPPPPVASTAITPEPPAASAPPAPSASASAAVRPDSRKPPPPAPKPTSKGSIPSDWN
jgi:serine/threonine-protein kinase